MRERIAVKPEKKTFSWKKIIKYKNWGKSVLGEEEENQNKVGEKKNFN